MIILGVVLLLLWALLSLPGILFSIACVLIIVGVVLNLTSAGGSRWY